MNAASNNLFAPKVLMVTFRLTTWLADAWAIGTLYTFGPPPPVTTKMAREKVVAVFDRVSGHVAYDHRVIASRRDQLPADRELVAGVFREAAACGASRRAVDAVVLDGTRLRPGPYRIDPRRRRPVRMSRPGGPTVRYC